MAWPPPFMCVCCCRLHGVVPGWHMVICVQDSPALFLFGSLGVSKSGFFFPMLAVRYLPCSKAEWLLCVYGSYLFRGVLIMLHRTLVLRQIVLLPGVSKQCLRAGLLVLH
jgi:hypothetical protein